MFLALTSASGSPGVSTTALALAMNSTADRSLLVEGDPVGSSPTLAGYLRGTRYHSTSLISLVDAHRRGKLNTELPKQLVEIPNSRVSLLPGLIHSAQVGAMTPVWGRLGAHLAGLAVEGADIIVDAGRLGHEGAPTDLISEAHVIAMVVKPDVRDLAALRAALNPLRRHLAKVKSRASLGLILIGENAYASDEVQRVTGLDVIAVIPRSDDAKLFSDGKALSKWRQRRSIYLHTLRLSTWSKIQKFTETHQPDWKLGTPTRSEDLPALTGGRRA